MWSYIITLSSFKCASSVYYCYGININDYYRLNIEKEFVLVFYFIVLVAVTFWCLKPINFKNENSSYRSYRNLKDQMSDIIGFKKNKTRIQNRTKYNGKKLTNDQLNTLGELILEAFYVYKSHQSGKHSDNDLKEEINTLKSEIKSLSEKIDELPVEDEKFKKIKDVFKVDKTTPEKYY